MFDIHEYYIGEPGDTLNDLEIQLSEEIESLLTSQPQLYTVDRYKKRGLCVNILTPSVDYPNGRIDVIDSASIRFQLSIFPEIEKLNFLQSVILRPRHIECGGVELVSLYIPAKKCIVLYLHCPFTYTFDNYQYDISREPYNLANITDPHELGTGIAHKKGADIPPLLYVLSTIASRGNDKTIDKFLFRTDTYPDQSVLVALDEISLFYAKNGY